MSKLNPVTRQEKLDAEARLAAEQLAKALVFIRNPDEWPLWPRLPLKRRIKHNEPTEVAVLLSQDESDLPIKVWRASVYDKIIPGITQYYEYISFEELLVEGKWEID